LSEQGSKSCKTPSPIDKQPGEDPCLNNPVNQSPTPLNLRRPATRPATLFEANGEALVQQSIDTFFANQTQPLQDRATPFVHVSEQPWKRVE
jgi:hypothetical protein